MHSYSDAYRNRAGFTYRWYCGRQLGVDAIPHSDGGCGPLLPPPAARSCPSPAIPGLSTSWLGWWRVPSQFPTSLVQSGQRVALTWDVLLAGPSNGPQCPSCTRYQQGATQARGTPYPYFAYEALNNTDTLHIKQ